MIDSTTICLGAFGFTFEAQLILNGQPADLSTATLIELHLEKQDGGTVTKQASLKTTGLDGRLAYLVLDGDIDQLGSWRRQFVVAGPGFRFPLTPVAFEVLGNIP